MASRINTDERDELDMLRLRVCLQFDALPDIKSNPVAPLEGFVARMAAEPGMSVAELLEWGGSSGDAVLRKLVGSP